MSKSDYGSLWRFNKTTGFWVHIRSVSADNGKQWLAVFERDEPDEFFRIAKRKPADDPRRKNPVRPLPGGVARELRQAARLYQGFSGHVGEFDVSRFNQDIPKTLAVIGVVDAIEYTTVRDGKRELYRHDFRLPADRKPILCAAPDGSKIFILGGDYRFTERGIVDERK
jgi:hypothetical protein